MKYFKLWLFALAFCPTVTYAASGEFVSAAQLLVAAKQGNVQQVQNLITQGADINYVDSTGLSLVCTAIMNGDERGAQILQMYGADASQCDRQIKQYNKKMAPASTGGMFSGLSSAHWLALAAGGAAIVVGGLFLLTDVFDADDDNKHYVSGGDRPGGGGADGSGGNGASSKFLTVPYSPAYLTSNGTFTTDDSNYLANLATWNPDVGGIRQKDFNFFKNYSDSGITLPLQNYLLMMHGYSAFANEYMGQGIFRDDARRPVPLGNSTGGGLPVKVGLVTENGVAPTGSLMRGNGIAYAESASATATTMRLDKFMNYNNPTIENSTIVLGTEKSDFDLSGNGTAMNPFASPNDTALAKIVGGWESGDRADGDLYGFVPNGQLAIFRTGGGTEWVDDLAATNSGTITKGAGNTNQNALQVGDTLIINGGHSYVISDALVVDSQTRPTVTVGETTFVLADGQNVLKGTCAGTDCTDVSDIAIYRGTDGNYYVNTIGDYGVDAVYKVDNNAIFVAKTLKTDADIKTFQVMAGNAGVGGLAVLANLALNPDSRTAQYANVRTMPGIIALNANVNAAVTFQNKINDYYNKDTTNDEVWTQGAYANALFSVYSQSMPMIIMPAGEFDFGAGAEQSSSFLDATFENYAPVLYPNLEHMFMTVVGVQHTRGTSAATSISGYGDGTGTAYGPLRLAGWVDDMGTEDATDNKIYYSRQCGVAGVGKNGVDPWCFAAAGATSEMAVASAAGAVASVKGAFGYMSTPQVFWLLALTADGPYLGTNPDGVAFTKAGLVDYLQNMYVMPIEYDALSMTADEYLRTFARVYGYGLINLERAMKPNHTIYYFDGDNIVSADGNAYWRSASKTAFRPSAVLRPRGASISAPFFDVVTSVDGQMHLPRVWENEFSLGTNARRALYMGDVLGDLKTRDDKSNRVDVGGLELTVARSERAYADNMDGLDELRFDYSYGNWNVTAGYQHYLTDGVSRFSGRANPIMSLAANAITSGTEYTLGQWAFGVRAFSGAVTEEGLLESDPVVSAQFNPARLGFISGGQSSIGWRGDMFALNTSVGTVTETNTVLGALSDGLLDMGAGRTMYFDTVLRVRPLSDVVLTMRATMARTQTNASGAFILGMSDIYSNAFSVGADIGNLNLTVAQPLTVSRGVMRYAYAKYDVVENNANDYDLFVMDSRVRDIDLSPSHRELRFVATYRHNLGEFTDGAVGVMYRMNPNNMTEFGNETMLMFKLSHRLGI